MKNKSAKPSIAIEGELTIFTSTGLKQRLLEVLENGNNEMEVELSLVSEISEW